MRVSELIEKFVLGKGVGESSGSVAIVEAGVGAHSALVSYDEPIAIRTKGGIFIAERPTHELLWSRTTNEHIASLYEHARTHSHRIVPATREEVREIAGYDPDVPADGVRVPGTHVSRDRYGRQMSFQGVAA